MNRPSTSFSHPVVAGQAGRPWEVRPGEAHWLGFLLRQLDDAFEVGLNTPIPFEHSVVPLKTSA